MKHLKLLFLILVLNSIIVGAQSVNPNQALVDLIPSKKWFEIENYYQQHKDSIDNEFVKLWYLAETGSVFNRPFEAIDAYEQLIDKNLLEMDMPTLTYLFGQPVLQLCADVQEYVKGEELCRKLMTIVQNDSIAESDIRLSFIQGLTQVIEDLKLGAKNYPKPEIIKNEVDGAEDIKLIPNKSGNGILFNAKWNGIDLRTYFDTGVTYGGYIRNREIAERIGVNSIRPIL